MNFDELESNHYTKYQEIVFLMKNIGLIKDKSRSRQFQNKTGEIYYE